MKFEASLVQYKPEERTVHKGLYRRWDGHICTMLCAQRRIKNLESKGELA